MSRSGLLERRTGWVPFVLLMCAMLLSFWPRPAAASAAQDIRQAAAGAPRLDALAAPDEDVTSGTDGTDGTNGIGGADPRALSDELAESQTEDLSLGQIEQFWNKLKNDYGGFFPEGEAPTLRELMFPKEGEGWSVKDVLLALARFFLHEVLYSGKLIVTIVLLAIFTMLLETMQSAFERQAVSQVAYAIAYMVLLIIAVNSFRTGAGYAADAIAGMVQFMLAMVPLLLTLLASTGGVTTVAVLHPVIVFMVHTIGTVIHLVVFPLLFFSAVLHLASTVSERFKVTQLANLLRTAAVGLLGAMLTLFLGVLSIQGATGAIADGVALRTAKFVTGNFVPVVGRMFSDAADTVLSASLLVKNAVGLAGVVILIFLCAFPAVKILTLALIYRLSAAVLQPLGDTPIVQCLQVIGKTLVYVFAALASVGLMFFLAVTIVLTAGNASILMR
ncbi:stage III sporulation protein AE [Cohnella hashimotonis]|uniref:Stage III sporulation protein AE n=1 Tax=Cohnella hashimotonis TaxID=2826895 RepID=A0ABT6TGB9_9BACL|nr:stage III sporulation protein AE [Cohnella hashimotonis]MDI4645353.1 stage III sporulation protein AE [Cohnella hashimotonis]